MEDIRVGDTNFSVKMGVHHVDCSVTVFQVILFQAHNCICGIHVTAVTDISVFIHAGAVSDG
jgi:hypothetical protein